MASETSTLIGVLGTSRSGSTWLGALLGSHPDVAYRFEPFHRMRSDERVHAARRLLDSDEPAPGRLERVYDALLPADPRAEKPPFFARSYRARCPVGKRFLWPAARKNAVAARLFRRLYTPLGRPPIVFKEINFERALNGLVNGLGLPIVYLVRHPCAVAWSHMRGQELGVMHSTREHGLAKRLATFDPELADRFAPHVDDLSMAQRRALLWRISVEQGLRIARSGNGGRVRVVIYERLCRDPAGELAELFRHVGLSVPEETLAFLRESTSASTRARLRRGEILSGAYFSVFRNPIESMTRWREQMPDDARREVIEILRDSPAYAYGLEHGGWDEFE